MSIATKAAIWNTTEQWQRAISDSAELLSLWGQELVRLGWTANDLFAVPYGLTWCLEGEGVTAPGESVAIPSSGPCVFSFEIGDIGREGELAKLLRLIDDDLIDAESRYGDEIVLAALQLLEARFQSFF